MALLCFGVFLVPDKTHPIGQLNPHGYVTYSITGAVVIAEGVENEFVAGQMLQAGILLGQGFGLGKPTPAEHIEDVRAALTGRAALSTLRPRAAARQLAN